VIVTKSLLEKLFSSFSLPLPPIFEFPVFPALGANDPLPLGVNKEELSYIGALVSRAGISMFSADPAPAGFEDDGLPHSFESLLDTGDDKKNGWIGMEVVLVRLNNSYAHSANFPVWSADPIVDASKFSSRIGYDAAVCVEMYEPWIVEIYNSSLGIPTTMSVVSKSASTDFEADDGNTGPYLDSYTRVLHSAGKGPAYSIRYVGS